MKVKLVREHIDFERGQDPKEAMGIGIIKRIEKEMRDHKKNLEITKENYHKILQWVVSKGLDEYVDFFLDYVDINFDGSSFLRIAAYYEQWKLAKYLIKKGADLDKAITYSRTHNEKVTHGNLWIIKRGI